jgi:hypothetical protein
MFKQKYTITILNVKWEPIKTNIKLSIIPRRDEFIYLDNQYYEVLNVIHTLNERQGIFLIINDLPSNIKNI